MRFNNLDPERQPVRNSANLCCQELARGTGESLGEWVYVTSSGDVVAIEDMDDYMAASWTTVGSDDSDLLSASVGWGWSCYPGLLDCSQVSMEDPNNTPTLRRYFDDRGPWTAAGAGSSWAPGTLDCAELELDVAAIFQNPQYSQDGVDDAPVEDGEDQPSIGVDDETESPIESGSEDGELTFFLRSLSLAMMHTLGVI